MDGGQITAIVIVAMILVASIIRAKYGYGKYGRRRDSGIAAEERSENLRLRDEVKELKERLKVLERITVDKENSLSRQIEELRDR